MVGLLAELSESLASKVAVKQLVLTKLVKHPLINYPMSHIAFMANNIFMTTNMLGKKLNKLLFDLGGMHTNNRKNQGHKILRGSAKAYIHGVHPHSTHTMKSMNTTVKNYHTTLTISHFSTWHSTPHKDIYNEKTI
jgi:hypothetical protein